MKMTRAHREALRRLDAKRRFRPSRIVLLAAIIVAGWMYVSSTSQLLVSKVDPPVDTIYVLEGTSHEVDSRH